jgi:hypothetical protein
MQDLITQLLETDRRQGEIACGPGFVLDLKLFPTPENLQGDPSIDQLYTFIETTYKGQPIEELQLEAEQVENLCGTLDRDRTSEYWNAAQNDREITREEFLPWLQECFLAEECYEAGDGENPYVDQMERLMMFASWVAPELFGESSSLVIHSLTDVNNENTPYGVFVAIGPVNTLLVVTRWIL